MIVEDKQLQCDTHGDYKFKIGEQTPMYLPSNVTSDGRTMVFHGTMGEEMVQSVMEEITGTVRKHTTIEHGAICVRGHCRLHIIDGPSMDTALGPAYEYELHCKMKEV